MFSRCCKVQQNLLWLYKLWLKHKNKPLLQVLYSYFQVILTFVIMKTQITPFQVRINEDVFIIDMNNKKVLLRDRKRHTARCVSSSAGGGGTGYPKLESVYPLPNRTVYLLPPPEGTWDHRLGVAAPLPVNRQTDTYKNITSHRSSYTVGKKWKFYSRVHGKWRTFVLHRKWS